MRCMCHRTSHLQIRVKRIPCSGSLKVASHHADAHHYAARWLRRRTACAGNGGGRGGCGPIAHGPAPGSRAAGFRRQRVQGIDG